MSEAIAQALKPIVLRVRRDVTWAKKHGRHTRTDNPLTWTALAEHVNGGVAIGVVPMLAGTKTTRIALLDLDSHGGEVSWFSMQRHGIVLAETAVQHGLFPIPFRSSGGKGIHIYFLWDREQDAYSVRQLLTQVLADCGFTNGVKGLIDNEVEIFPKQDEIRPGAYGNQFILPLAGLSVPLDVGTFEVLSKESIIDRDFTLSFDVPLQQRPVRVKPVDTEPKDLEDWQEALRAIPNSGDNELDYDGWRNIIFAIHSASGGSDEGLALAHEFSAKSSRYDGDFLDNRVWPYITDEGGITVRTIKAEARKHGWQESLDEYFIPAVVESSTGEPVEHDPDLPAFNRERNGDIKPTVDNTVKAVEREDLCGMRIGYDTFRDEITVSAPGEDAWRPMKDSDMVRIRIDLERVGFKSAPKELARDAVVLVAEKHSYDSAQLWLDSVKNKWDGVSRVETFLHRYFGAEDTPYTRAVSLYIWTALAGRILDPGCQADMAPMLFGAQGAGKSTGISALSPAPEFFTEIDLGDDDDTAARKLRGVLVGEIAELKGLQSRDEESIKKFITRRFEKWVPKYREFTTTFARRCLMFGTTNIRGQLSDSTGNRRWLPLEVGKVDLAAIKRDRDQLWAEGAQMFEVVGIEWEVAERLGKDEHPNFMAGDPWTSRVASWLNEISERDPSKTNGELPIDPPQVLSGALFMRAADMLPMHEKRVRGVLTSLGYVNAAVVNGGVFGRFWVKKD